MISLAALFSRAMDASALDVPADDVAHFASVERLADVIVRAEPQRFLRGLERAESRQHDHRDMRIDLADPPQAIDAVRARHADVADDRVGPFLAQQANAGFDGIRGVHLVVRLQEHAQTFARANFIIDDEHLRQVAGYGHTLGDGKISLSRWRFST